MDLNGAVAVVTGASSGCGQAIASALEARGMVVAAVSRSSERFATDISNPAAVERLKAAVTSELGTPCVVVNAAGVFGPVASIVVGDAAEWIETIMINTVGPYLVSRAFVGGMVQNGWGRIVNLSSAASLGTPGPFNSAYCTSKVALNQTTRQLAAELQGTGVTANVIHPGDVKTAMWRDIKNKSNDAATVEETGGDPPEKCADLVLDIIAGNDNGKFLWIESPHCYPTLLPSWNEGHSTNPGSVSKL
jgi:NAD(P)-dependent dehydrogenase (short-subunit alcohol dehydrogenase family)